MTNTNAAHQVSLLTRLPAPSAPPPQLASGTVTLFRDDNWGSQRLDINTGEFVPNQRQRVQSFMFDEATFAAFNLPLGTVMTLMDNVTPTPSGKIVADLSGCGRCVDLVGTGRTEAVDLRAVNMNDCVSAFFWREVDLDFGAIELFDDTNFGGNRSTVFLSEWNSGTIYSIQYWWLQDRISSLRWKTLNDRQTGVLFDNSDGSGDQYANIKGWGNTKEIASLPDVGFNDRASAWRWDGIVPMKEIIAPFNVVASSVSGSSGLTSVVTGTNNSPMTQPVTVVLNNSDAQTVTVATMDQWVTGVSTTITEAATEGVPTVASSTETWSVTLNYSYTRSETRTTSETKTIALSISQTVNAPPNSSYKATLLVNIGQIPATVYHTTAQRWYNVPVTGGVADPTNNNWYKRVEPVTVTMSGSLASTTTVNMDSKPLSGTGTRAA
jgi:hypothetical protein